MSSIQFICKGFYELSLDELYACLQLRQAVFAVEQNCPYQDADDKDQQGLHFMGWNDAGQLVAYSRILPKGVYYVDYLSIGRVTTSEKIRGSGGGKALMRETLAEIEKRFEKESIKISAQSYLIRFYRSFGFKEEGEEYLEDGIPHIAMIRP